MIDQDKSKVVVSGNGFKVSKKPLLIKLVFILLLIIISVVYVINKDKKSTENTNTTAVQPTELIAPPPAQSDIEYARIHQTAIGTISNINAIQITVKTKDNKSQSFNITKSTTYSAGNDYLDGKRSDVKVGQSVSVTYNPDNQEAWTIWYAF